MVIDSFTSIYPIIFNIPLFTMLWSLLCALVVSDIKSIIAFPTISQISYMFLALFINPLLCLFHIIIHALFKSILSLLAGSMIHIQYNYQSIYKIKINHSFIFIIFLLVGSVLIISLSKEIMIQSFNYIIIASFSWIILCIGGVSTILYTLKIYIHCFYFLEYLNVHDKLIITPSYTLNNDYLTSYPFYFSDISPYPIFPLFIILLLLNPKIFI